MSSEMEENIVEGGNGGEQEEVDLDADDLIFVSEERIDLDDPGFSGGDYQAEDEVYGEQNEEAFEGEEGGGEDGNNGEEGNMEGEGEENGEGDGKEDGDKSQQVKEGLMVVDQWDEEVETDLEDDGAGVEIDETVINPELKEKLMLSMPSHKTLLADIGHLKQNRRVVIEPLTVEELKHDKLQQWASSDACTEFKIQFLKSSDDEITWKGIAVLHFRTCGAAANAAEELKEIRSDLTVKVDTNTNQAIEQFCKTSRNEKRWPDNVVLIRHLHINEESNEDTVNEFLKEQCPDVEQIIIHKEHSSKSRSASSSKDKESKDKDNKDSSKAAKDEKTTAATTSTSASSGPPRGYAYLVFPSRKVAQAVVEDFDARIVEYEGHRLIAQLYDIPADIIPRGLLKLRERRAIMNHMEKLSAKIEKHKTEPESVKLPEKAEDRVKKCKDLIDKDNRARKDIYLPVPTLEELRAMSGLPVMSASESQRLLVHLGVIRSRKPELKDNKDRDRRDGNRRGSSRNRNDRRYSRPSPPRNSNRRGAWGGNRSGQRSGGGGRAMNSGGSGGLGLGGVNPLAQLMLQQNLGMISGATGLNPAAAVNLMMQPGANLLANANILANQRAGLGGSAGYGGGSDDRSNKVLRLDEMGNFRADDNRYNGTEYGGRGPNRGDYYDNRDRGRYRSRSPNFDQGARNRGAGMRDDYRGSSRGGEDGSQDNPVNLLLNLSQMLSQKIEQKRGAMDNRDKRGYDSRDYHAGRR